MRKEKYYYMESLIDIMNSFQLSWPKEIILKIISLLEKEDNEKEFYLKYISYYIDNLVLEINGNKSIIFGEELINVLLYITLYFKNIFTIEIFEQILNTCIFLILENNSKDMIILTVYKILSELLNVGKIESNNIYILLNVLYILTLKILKECNINDYISEYLLMTLYLMKVVLILLFK